MLALILNWNCYAGDDRITEILIQNGANVNLTNSDEDTPLHIAAFIGMNIFFSTLNHFIQHKIHWILNYSIGREEIVELLVKNGADVNRKNKNEKTALDIAVEKGDWTVNINSKNWISLSNFNQTKLNSIIIF